jgi:hypothetical protein
MTTQFAIESAEAEYQERRALIARLLLAGADWTEIARRLEVFDTEHHPEPEREMK